MKFTVLRFDSVGSTNTEALNQAARGANEGVCIVARQQTAGRGRHGRTWISPAGSGLYFSVLTRPTIELRFKPLLTLMTAIAVHDAIFALYDLDCDIKWVNDIHVGGKKICGILAESAETPAGLAIVIGVGVNLQSSNFPAELSETATSIAAETGCAPDAEKVFELIASNISRFYDVLHGHNGAAKIRFEWWRRSTYAFGKDVKIKTGAEIFTGTTRGIEENGALRVELDSGEIRSVHAGEVENLRRADSAS